MANDDEVPGIPGDAMDEFAPPENHIHYPVCCASVHDGGEWVVVIMNDGCSYTSRDGVWQEFGPIPNTLAALPKEPARVPESRAASASDPAATGAPSSGDVAGSCSCPELGRTCDNCIARFDAARRGL